MLTEDFSKLEGQPIIDQYEPEDKESLVAVYCDVLRGMTMVDKSKNIQYQIDEHKRTVK